MIVQVIQWLAFRVNRWAAGVLDRRNEAAMLKLFPLGLRVIMTAGCPCGRDHFGKTGYVVDLTTSGKDFRVSLDGETGYVFVCTKGMVKA